MMRRALWTVAIIGVVLIAGTVAAAPLALSVERHVIAGGGGVVAAGPYRVWGTVGQPVVGWTAAESVRVCAGFWCTGTYTVYLPLVLKSTF